ncbi:MAG: oxidoreductase [Chloroflexi bacterium]|nr:MAG: oxidoreductase [Chloroflexota bacterium]RLC87440.1 MAG: oxidoreductase [Chloroflexota bacterium]
MAAPDAKPKLAFYWAASCGGCEITITELGMRLIDVGDLVDIVFWPCAMDFKYSDVEALGDGEIDVCFFNGAIRCSENEHIANLLRRKSKLLVAFGSCAYEGCIPGLANLYDAESVLERVYDTAPSLDDSRGTRPTPSSQVPEDKIEIPVFYDRVKTLAQTVDVDYFMPGCPPVVDQVWNVFQTLLAGELPAKGAIIGADAKTNCDVCPRQKGESGMRIKEFKRPHEVTLDPDVCFLTQGILCCGPATRAGCGLPCINGNMPCRGCYGPPDGVVDQGSKLLSAIAALIDTDEPEELPRILDTIVDPTGTFYRFSLADSILSELKYKRG